MLVLKLRRTGKKHQPFYRLIVSERRSKINGRFVDNLGWYNPRAKNGRFDKERIVYWLKQGAQKTDTVHNLLVKTGIISSAKVAVHKTGKKNKVDQENKAQKTMDEMVNPTPNEGQPEVNHPESAPEQPAAPASESPAAPESAPVAPVEEQTPAAPAPETELPGTEAVEPTEEKPAEEHQPEEMTEGEKYPTSPSEPELPVSSPNEEAVSEQSPTSPAEPDQSPAENEPPAAPPATETPEEHKQW